MTPRRQWSEEIRTNKGKKRFLWMLSHAGPGLYQALQAGRITLEAAAGQADRFPPKRDRTA